MTISSFLLIGVHTLIAWVLVEVFVNTGHKLKRTTYLGLHYLVLVMAFMLVFWVYFAFFNTTPVFWTTLTACGFILALEWIVFRYLYSGDRWFLNWCDWILPMFIVASSIYFVGSIV